MAEEAARSRLGRGLAALIGDVRAETSVERPRGQRRLPTAALRPNARNPRRAFADAELDELAASVRERGIIQPIIVRLWRGAADEYEIIAGERRWHVANTLRLLKLSDGVKAHIRSGKLSAGHARMLIGAPDADALAEEIVTRALNVRQVEA